MGSSEAAEVNYHGTIEDANRLESSEPLKGKILEFLQFVCGYTSCWEFNFFFREGS